MLIHISIPQFTLNILFVKFLYHKEKKNKKQYFQSSLKLSNDKSYTFSFFLILHSQHILPIHLLEGGSSYGVVV